MQMCANTLMQTSWSFHHKEQPLKSTGKACAIASRIPSRLPSNEPSRPSRSFFALVLQYISIEWTMHPMFWNSPCDQALVVLCRCHEPLHLYLVPGWNIEQLFRRVPLGQYQQDSQQTPVEHVLNQLARFCSAPRWSWGSQARPNQFAFKL